MGRSNSRITKTDLRRAIELDGGIVSKMAARFGVTRQTIYRRLDETGLRAEVDRARTLIYDMAVDNVVAWLEAGDATMTRWALERYPGGPRWSAKVDVDVTGIAISDESRAMLEELGVTVESAAEAFEAHIRRLHAQMVGDDAES